MNDFLLGICLSIYPGLRNTCADLPKVVCSSCFKILRIHFKITRKTQEIAFQGFPISKFSRGSMPPNPPRYLAPSARDCPPQLQCLGAATVYHIYNNCYSLARVLAAGGHLDSSQTNIVTTLSILSLE